MLHRLAHTCGFYGASKTYSSERTALDAVTRAHGEEERETRIIRALCGAGRRCRETPWRYDGGSERERRGATMVATIRPAEIKLLTNGFAGSSVTARFLILLILVPLTMRARAGTIRLSHVRLFSSDRARCVHVRDLHARCARGLWAPYGVRRESKSARARACEHSLLKIECADLY